MKQYRTVWKRGKYNGESFTIWHSDEYAADRQSDELRRGGNIVLRKETRDINLAVLERRTQ